MQKRKLLLVLAVIVLPLVVLSALFLIVPDDPRVGAKDVARVEIGMSPQQVEAICGGRASRARPADPAPGRVDGVPSTWPWTLGWDGYAGHADVMFSGDGFIRGTVIETKFTPAAPDPWSGPLRRRFERLKRWRLWRTEIRDG